MQCHYFPEQIVQEVTIRAIQGHLLCMQMHVYVEKEFECVRTIQNMRFPITKTKHFLLKPSTGHTHWKSDLPAKDD